MMVLVTTLVGYYLGTEGTPSLLRLLHTLLGTALAAGGTLALNQYVERDLDARMDRTRHRPLPDGRLLPVEALVFGIALLVGGLAYLQIAVGAPAALVTTAIAATYLLLYTPLKPVTSLCSLVGAVPGALPPVAGWAAARGDHRARGLGAVRDHVPVADPPHARDRPHVPRRLRPRRHPRAARHRPRRLEHRDPRGA